MGMEMSGNSSMMTSGMTPAEAILVSDRNKCDDGFFGGANSWVFFLFFLLAWGGNGFGFGGNAAAQGALTRAELYDGLNYNQLENAIRGVQNGLCDGFYAQNTTMLQGFNGVQRDLCTGFNAVNAGIAENRFAAQQCCCETNRNIDAVRYENAKNTCDITSAIHAEGEATRALINANTMQDLRDRLEAKNQELMTANFQLSQQAQSANLIDQLRPCARPAYITCSPYQAAPYQYSNCGCNTCGC